MEKIGKLTTCFYANPHHLDWKKYHTGGGGLHKARGGDLGEEIGKRPTRWRAILRRI